MITQSCSSYPLLRMFAQLAIGILRSGSAFENAFGKAGTHQPILQQWYSCEMHLTKALGSVVGFIRAASLRCNGSVSVRLTVNLHIQPRRYATRQGSSDRSLLDLFSQVCAGLAAFVENARSGTESDRYSRLSRASRPLADRSLPGTQTRAPIVP